MDFTEQMIEIDSIVDDDEKFNEFKALFAAEFERAGVTEEMTDLFRDDLPQERQVDLVAAILKISSRRYFSALYQFEHQYDCLDEGDCRSLNSFLKNWESDVDFSEIRQFVEMEKCDVRMCDACGSWEYDEEVGQLWCDSNYKICRKCKDNDYRWSDYYDAYIYDGNVSENAVNQRGYSCVIDVDDDNFHWCPHHGRYEHFSFDCPYESDELITDYHSSKGKQNPVHNDWSASRKGRYFGVELEVEMDSSSSTRDEHAERFNDAFNNGNRGYRCFFETDGSLDDGFEIISQPLGMPDHRKLWAAMKNRPLTKGLTSHQTTTCGLHVHVSRNALSEVQVARIVTFVNHPDNERLIRAVARRYAKGYCKIKSKNLASAAHSDDRYEAVNITSSRTIEFRIFRGTLKYESIMAAVQFVNALVDFTDVGEMSESDLSTDKFLEFINNPDYVEADVLAPYIANRLEIA